MLALYIVIKQERIKLSSILSPVTSTLAGPASITWFDRMYVIVRFIEKNLLYPAVFLSGISLSTPTILAKFGL